MNKTAEHEGDGDTSCYWHTWNSSQKFGNWKTNRDHPNLGIINQPEYWEESWRPDEIYCHSDVSKKKTPVETGMKKKEEKYERMFSRLLQGFIRLFHFIIKDNI